MDFLYRGYNSTMTFKEAMTPKSPSPTPESGAEFDDDRVECGDPDFTFGLSVNNTIHSHEYGGNGEATAGISTTLHFEMAKKYALGRSSFASGYVIKMSVSALRHSGVDIHPIKGRLTTTAISEDDEHWIYFNGHFPEEAVVELIAVFRD
ncbi:MULTISPECIES: hypothetical protein [Yersinia pseudotuberculosis complex]|uniref:Uncharacterized protein n=1 Tax=Yersinia pseudotuberculosis serotype O:1b (strain IP 31758) TaxID=349747 RepID=A0A0U1QTM1_YERP3|nr:MULTISPECIES: hypothetical protein [Yersinia pseudotuberculosis complex]EKN4699683.1 hypothetical protein [Yersinia ruckeri]ABS45730.1 hypothetical protein YpsIP31758_B0081 [Yersinia pseudotuberculosis IP 31758]MCE4113242.1 hypothetical protein [Yersinia pseudotuberculosis]RYC26254.1 hypothetical protein EU971_11285 [Yersinia pseudotuberculosis]UFA64082.1 Uncharacterized protein YP598_4474 [Yersinia pseudotuberculosis]